MGDKIDCCFLLVIRFFPPLLVVFFLPFSFPRSLFLFMVFLNLVLPPSLFLFMIFLSLVLPSLSLHFIHPPARSNLIVHLQEI